MISQVMRDCLGRPAIAAHACIHFGPFRVTSYLKKGGWRIIEVWKSKAEANQFFAKNVAPYLPTGIHPKRSVQELHSLLTS